MTSEFMGPPWQADWTKEAEDNRNALPALIRALVDAARAELVTAKDPYFRGIDSDRDLPTGMSVEPVQSIRPGGEHILYFDHGRGWLRYHFAPRTTDPQIVIDECFWQ
ncbi:hypothetical protein OG426_22820 [Streptomyces canus]|uniref:hypothetical protein n=1 Tax=Streptomyces canus TaxID=58343 RepID=UPI00224ED780|nr:hypothetical protein [Streptomyces canus]MCX4859651.1 hypothetical protein [Streptomyces canus]WSW35104.1 hypothetical protein OG426_22820 [Streptomyces canus]